MRWSWPLLVLFICFSLSWGFASSTVAPLEIAQTTPPDQTAHSEGTQHQIKESFWQRTTSDPLALYTLLLTAFTGILAISTVGLWRQTSRLAHDAEKNSVASQRAFVFAVNLNPWWSQEPDGSYSWRFRPTWRNSGDSPTRKLTQHVVCELRNSRLPDSYDFTYHGSSVSSGLLGPKFEQQGALAPDQPDPPISTQDLIDVQAERKYLYLIGWAFYGDGLPNTPQRVTRFCWQIVPMGDAPSFNPAANKDSLRFNYVHHHRGNCADDECET
jgi:hypothetical protein